MREAVEAEQKGIDSLQERSYRAFLRTAERQKADMEKQQAGVRRTAHERLIKAVFAARRRIGEVQLGAREARVARNRGTVRFHERMLKEYAKRKDEDRARRMEALKNNDVDAYRAMLEQQQMKEGVPGDAKERFEVLSSFLAQTEEYLRKLGSKITAIKTQQEKDDAVQSAAAAARAQVGPLPSPPQLLFSLPSWGNKQLRVVTSCD